MPGNGHPAINSIFTLCKIYKKKMLIKKFITKNMAKKHYNAEKKKGSCIILNK